MKIFLKNPLKLISAVVFVMVMGFGMSTSLSVSESNGNIDLFALNSASAQSEGGGDCTYRNGYKAFTNGRGGAYDCCQKWRSNKPKTREKCF